MAIVKSKLLKEISDNYPNFLRKDLEKFLEIILNEIKKSLTRNEACEIRGFGRFSTNKQKKSEINWCFKLLIGRNVKI